ncbi:MAG: amidohydrolase family protein [Actinomycetota bacterium]|nr:amidohydrolase family protein [Actinomycetota bacterium]
MRTLYRASRVHTLSHGPSGEWLLVDGRHVERTGTGPPPDAERVVELPGTTIIPGFIDSHVHLTGTGIVLGAPEAAEATSAQELVGSVRSLAAGREEPLLLPGYDETRWSRPELPSIEELDAASPVPLLLVRTDGHAALANSAAIDAAGVQETEGLDRDARGTPTGLATRGASERLRRWFSERLSKGDVQGLQLRAAALAASRGVTCVHEMSIPKERGLRDLETLLEHRDRLPVDVVTYLATTDIPQVIDLRFPRVGGDLAIDGSIGARTAHLSRGYEDGEGSGAAYLDGDALPEFLHAAHNAELQVGVHAIGDAAIERLLDAWERVHSTLDSRGRRHFRARRHRVEHFEMPSDVQIERAAMLGLAISVQPAFDAEWGHPGALYDRRLGWDRAGAMNPFRTLLERGMELGAGSDSPVTPLDPLAGIAALERHHAADQRLSRIDALRLFTWGSARLAHQEDKKGRLAPGAHADFAVYDEDPMLAPAIEELRPVLTVSLGREVFAS